MVKFHRAETVTLPTREGRIDACGLSGQRALAGRGVLQVLHAPCTTRTSGGLGPDVYGVAAFPVERRTEMKSKPLVLTAVMLGLGGLCIGSQALAQAKPEDTELWKPVPAVVTPAKEAGGAPSDAIVLFDGGDLKEWVATQDKSPAAWTVADDVLTVDKTRGNIETKRSFRDYQLHLEWRIPADITGSGQARGNSGVFLASTGPGDRGYELQVLDPYQNPTYVNGQAASLYKQHPPLVNAGRKPGEWQVYDVVWRAPVFGPDGALVSPAIVTVLHNGVLVQDNAAFSGETVYIGKPPSRPFTSAPIKLQAHGDPSAPISFRNIWVRELPPRS